MGAVVEAVIFRAEADSSLRLSLLVPKWVFVKAIAALVSASRLRFQFAHLASVTRVPAGDAGSLKTQKAFPWASGEALKA